MSVHSLRQVLALLLIGLFLSGCATVAGRANVQQGFVPTPDGGSIYYRAEGNGSPVILLHSGFSHSDMWAPTLPALAGRRVIRFDARAHGRTPIGAKPVLAANDVRTVMDALGIARADFIGSSIGGSTVFDFALLEPNRVGRIIVAGSAPIGGTRASPEEVQPTFDIFTTAKERGLEAGIDKWVNHPMNSAASPAVRERLRQLARQSPAFFSIGSVENFPLTFLQPLAMTRLAELKQPVLIVIGGRDLPTLRKNAAQAVAGLPDARMVIFENAGHFPSLEDSTRFNTLVRDFLAGR